jgi:hypothetical protein
MSDQRQEGGPGLDAVAGCVAWGALSGSLLYVMVFYKGLGGKALHFSRAGCGLVLFATLGGPACRTPGEAEFVRLAQWAFVGVWALRMISWRRCAPHSQFEGFSRFALLAERSGLPYTFAAAILEPLIVFVGGYHLAPHHAPVGVWLMATAPCLLVRQCFLAYGAQKLRDDLNDAEAFSNIMSPGDDASSPPDRGATASLPPGSRDGRDPWRRPGGG